MYIIVYDTFNLHPGLYKAESYTAACFLGLNDYVINLTVSGDHNLDTMRQYAIYSQ